MYTPDLESYLRQTGGTRPMAVSREILADMETPVSAYWKLAHDSQHSFLLESVTGGEQLARYSILGIEPAAVLRTKDRLVRKESGGQTREWTLTDGEDPLTALAGEMPKEHPILSPDLPPFVGGAVGMLSYDFVRFVEKLGPGPQDDLQMPDMAMMLVESAVVFDHAKNLIHVLERPARRSTSWLRDSVDLCPRCRPVPGRPGR
jgi:anthranilate synthase component 1